MRTTPSRRTTLQFLQIFLTEARTFISFFSLYSRGALAHPVCDSAAGQVVRRQFYRDLVASQDLDVMHSHLARNMSQHLVPVVERHSEHRIGEGFLNRPLYFDRVAFRHFPVRLKFRVRWR